MMLKKCCVLGIIVLLLSLSWLPSVSGDSPYSINKEVLAHEKSILSSSEDIFDDLIIKAHGTYLIEIIFALRGGLNLGLLKTMVTNLHYKTITLETHFTLVATRGNRVLDEFDDFFELDPGYMRIAYFFTRCEWKYYEYRFGRFDLTWDIYIPEADSSKTLVFHGFVFPFGTVVFNPLGKEI